MPEVENWPRLLKLRNKSQSLIEKKFLKEGR